MNEEIRKVLYQVHAYAGTAGTNISDVRSYISNLIDEFPICMTCGTDLETETDLRERYCSDCL